MRFISLAAAACLGSAYGAAAAPVCLDFETATAEVISFEGKPANAFKAMPNMLEILSSRSVSIVAYEAPPEMRRAKRITWRWRATGDTPETDLAAKSGDDRPAALYVAFRYKKSGASLMQRLRRSAVEMVGGEDAPGRVIAYTWGGDRPVGSIYQSPYFGAAHIVWTLRTIADLGGAYDEAADLAADHRALFDDDDYEIQYLGFVADTDDTSSRATARFKSVCLE